MAWLAAAPALQAENGALPHDKRISWLSYNADHPVNRRWSLHFDGSYRPMYGADWRQWLVRPGVNYRFTDRWQVSLTYSYFSTHPNGLAESDGAVAEHRMHQQAEYSHPWHGNVLRHRFRMEERWVSSPWREGEPRSWRWQDRPRYMLRMDRPLRRNGPGGAPLTLTLYDEIFVSFRARSASAFDQNRVYAGVTWKLGRHFAADMGAFYQTLKPQNGGALEHNIVFVTLLRNNTPLRELFGWLHRR
ncbi:MAG: DUF2490 domain-containing protein [Bryobacteraceae bacterium]|nr:DUF2490 domain-containing protein [Bryobacteraceae bacterium]MCX7603744.1 DUF2490 domain-containing protein [Bryobacteraceae bacterium]